MKDTELTAVLERRNERELLATRARLIEDKKRIERQISDDKFDMMADRAELINSGVDMREAQLRATASGDADWRSTTQALGSARLLLKSANRKLSPVDLVDFPGQPRPRPIPRGPFVAATYASIEATCPDSCAWKGAGCFADAGFTRMQSVSMNAAARRAEPLAVMREEARLIREAFPRHGKFAGRVPQDGARGGRDLRLHVGGDVTCSNGARELGRAADHWRSRGGGSVWSFTHRWRRVRRAAWGPAVSVLASVEHPTQVAEARAQGYPAALVVDQFWQDTAYPVARGVKLLPCPAETRGTTCAACRLCLDRDLLAMGVTIGFQAHGRDVDKLRAKLVQIGRKRR